MYYKLGTTSILILLMSLLLQDTLEAQRRTRTTSRDRGERTDNRRSREEVKNDLNTWYGFSLGTLGFGSSFSISGKFKYGLQLKERISVGLSAKGFYDLLTLPGPDVGLLSYGGNAFTRFKITDEIYLHGEYGYTDFEGITTTGIEIREGILYPSVGGGYSTGFGKWKYGFHVLLPLNDRAREFVSLEYWIDFVHNF